MSSANYIESPISPLLNFVTSALLQISVKIVLIIQVAYIQLLRIYRIFEVKK